MSGQTDTHGSRRSTENALCYNDCALPQQYVALKWTGKSFYKNKLFIGWSSTVHYVQCWHSFATYFGCELETLTFHPSLWLKERRVLGAQWTIWVFTPTAERWRKIFPLDTEHLTLSTIWVPNRSVSRGTFILLGTENYVDAGHNANFCFTFWKIVIANPST